MADHDAIQENQDVPEVEAQEQKNPEYLDSRAGIVEAIAETVERERMAEMGIEPEPKPEIETPEGDQPEPEAKKEAESEAQAVELVTVKIDGEERQVPLSEVLEAGKRTYQKETAADKRLEEATRLLKEAKELATAPAPIEPKTDYIPDGIEALRNAIQYGDDAEFAAALKKINSTGFTQPADIKQVVAQEVEQRVFRDRFLAPPEEGGFKDIMDNPELFLITRHRVDEALKSGEPNTFETYRKAAQGVRDQYTPKTTEKIDPFQAKKEQKRTLDPVKGAGIKQAAPEEKEQTPSEIIAEMAKLRGQTVY